MIYNTQQQADLNSMRIKWYEDESIAMPPIAVHYFFLLSLLTWDLDASQLLVQTVYEP